MSVKNTYLSMGRRLRMIRELAGLNQETFAGLLEIKRPSLSQMEGDKILPSLRTIGKIVAHFNISYRWLLEGRGDMHVGKEVSASASVSGGGAKQNKASLGDAASGRQVRLASSADMATGESAPIAFVPLKVQAGYIHHRAEDDYWKGLQRFSLPGFSSKKSRAFQVYGDSMQHAVSHEDWLVCEHIDSPEKVKEGTIYVFITADSLLCKRVEDRLWDQGCFILKSDNTSYPDQRIEPSALKEIWRVRAKISSDFDSAMRALAAERKQLAAANESLATMNRLMRLMDQKDADKKADKEPKKRREGDSNPR